MKLFSLLLAVFVRSITLQEMVSKCLKIAEIQQKIAAAAICNNTNITMTNSTNNNITIQTNVNVTVDPEPEPEPEPEPASLWEIW